MDISSLFTAYNRQIIIHKKTARFKYDPEWRKCIHWVHTYHSTFWKFEFDLIDGAAM